jgi:PTS system N-acetylglucosamine-specific IIC component
MYHAAPKDRRKAVAGLLMSMALTSFLTGVTEPIEFTFMFLAPALYVVHALLTGAAFIVMQALGVKLGFGFSAGLFDYVLNFGKATHPLLLLPIGAVYFGLYYGVFRWAITRFDLKTPGRDIAAAQALAPPVAERGRAFLEALGGAANLSHIDACTTRLRLVIVEPSRVDEARLRQLGARGLVRPSERSLQVVLGPVADQVAGELRSLALIAQQTGMPAPGPAAISAATVDPQPWRKALGGLENVRSGLLRSSRILLDLGSVERIDEEALRALGVRALVRGPANSLQLILGPQAADVAAGLGWAEAGEGAG